MKRLLCGVLALMLLMLGTCPPALAEKLVDSGDVGTIHWELDSKGKLTVTGTGIIEKIPAIEYYNKKVKSVEIGDEITEIGDEAFPNLLNATQITIGKKVQEIRACSYYCINYHCKQDKASKDNVEFVVASENPPEPLDSPKESFNLISTSVEFLIIFPWITAVLLWGNNRMITKLHGHSSHVVALISAIHEK